MIYFKEENKKLHITKDKIEIGSLEYIIAADEAQIINLKIEEEYREKGYGKKLLQHWLDQIKSPNIKSGWLDVRTTNKKTISFYQKFSFKIITTRKDYYKKPPDDSYLMKLELS